MLGPCKERRHAFDAAFDLQHQRQVGGRGGLASRSSTFLLRTVKAYCERLVLSSCDIGYISLWEPDQTHTYRLQMRWYAACFESTSRADYFHFLLLCVSDWLCRSAKSRCNALCGAPIDSTLQQLRGQASKATQLALG